MSTDQNALTDDDNPAAREGQRGPAWPLVVGVVAIVVMGVNLLRLVIELTVRGMWILELEGDGTRLLQLGGALHLGQYFWDLVFVVTLVLAAVALIRRRGAARAYLMIWAVLDILYVAMFTAQKLGRYYDPQTNHFATPDVFRLLAEGALALALPIFLLIWLCRDKIKEQVKGWADQSTGEQRAAIAKRADESLGDR